MLGGGTAEGIAFVGDTIFAGSAGRTDLTGGDSRALSENTCAFDEVIPPETQLLCGQWPCNYYGL